MKSRAALFFILVLCLSLATLPPFCGNSWAGEMVLIPGGSFSMGSLNGKENESPAHTVYVDPFLLDRYPVTNAEYAEFLNAAGNREEEGKKWLDTDSLFSWWLCKIKEKNGRFIPRSGYEHHPAVKVSWYGALAYAKWAGKRLPTEAEWERAARGGPEGKKYATGDSISPEQANVGGFHGSCPVGAYPPNGYGLYDMVANVLQWCSDWYDSAYYTRSPRKNPRGPEKGTEKVLRGGSWYHPDGWPVAARFSDSPLSSSFCFVTGFRCARDLPK